MGGDNVNITNEMYSKLPNLMLGFHGCDKDTFDRVIVQHKQLKPSNNTYDWLGNGIYFWENSYERANEWACNKFGDKAAVIGAVLDLGYCLNLTDYNSSKILKMGYDALEASCNALGKTIPTNKNGRSSTDVLLRDLDCAVIQQVHALNKYAKKDDYDSVRGVFTEGEPMYPGAALVEKTHIQICIVNPNCIKGYFAPMELNKNYAIP